MEMEIPSLPFPKEGFTTFSPWTTQDPALSHLNRCYIKLQVLHIYPKLMTNHATNHYETGLHMTGPHRKTVPVSCGYSRSVGLVCTSTRHTSHFMYHTLPFRSHHLSIFLQGTGQMLVH